jgi:LTXXQ motif family protein
MRESPSWRSSFVKRRLLAAALAATTVIAVPIIARSAQDADTQPAQVAQAGEPQAEEHGGGPGHWRRGEGGLGMEGRRGMMMHRMMMRRDPKERCEERLAWRAAMRAYTEAKLDLTPEQRPLWDRVQSIAQTEQQKERQLCAALKPRDETTVLDRLDRMQQFLSTRLEALQAARPAVQALYQALAPEQRATFDHPFRP